MTTTLSEGKLAFRFPAGWRVSVYDQWPFYQDRFKDSCGGNRAVDLIAFAPDRVLWLIEVKDYRFHRRMKDLTIWEEIALKVRDSLAGLVAAKVADGHPDQGNARQALAAGRLRVVLHLEQPAKHTKLFPRTYDLEVVRLKLRQLLKPIDAHPRVVELASMNYVPWTATSIP